MLSTLAAMVVAPNEAFATIRERPAWMWALGVTIVLAMVGNLLAGPATRHVLEVSLPAQLANNPSLAGLPPDQIAAKTQKVMALAVLIANFWWLSPIFFVPLATVTEATVLFAVRSLSKSRATFAQLFALAAHVQFIALGIFSLVLGTIVALRPIDSFHTNADFLSSVPSAAWLVPGASVKVAVFLAMLGPFQMWATAVLGLGLIGMAQFRPPVAWASAIVILLAGAACYAALIQ